MEKLENMATMNTILPASSTRTVVLATNQFQCERLIKAGRAVADITKTNLIVLNVQSNEYPPNPQAIQHLYNISREKNAVMNVLYSEDSYKTIVKYIKNNKTINVITGIPSTQESVLHKIWRKFTHINFFIVDKNGNVEGVTDKTIYSNDQEIKLNQEPIPTKQGC